MQISRLTLLLSLATPLLAADIFKTNVPSSCTAVCQPMSDLTSQCDEGASSPRAGCICTNESFDVAVVGGLCDSCLTQNNVQIKELQSLSSACQFETASYNAQATALVAGVSVADVNTAATLSSAASSAMATATDMSAFASSSSSGEMNSDMTMTMTMTITDSQGRPSTMTMTGPMAEMTDMSGMDMNAAVGREVPMEKVVLAGYLGVLWGVFGML